ncbi:MAG: hypothetical protein M3O70_22755 [Actinomycetota bacterium]|nr:hypothetical protein [Actinomycetota bacterium]
MSGYERTSWVSAIRPYNRTYHTSEDARNRVCTWAGAAGACDRPAKWSVRYERTADTTEWWTACDLHRVDAETYMR